MSKVYSSVSSPVGTELAPLWRDDWGKWGTVLGTFRWMPARYMLMGQLVVDGSVWGVSQVVIWVMQMGQPGTDVWWTR